jgi:hypothetical protein
MRLLSCRHRDLSGNLLTAIAVGMFTGLERLTKL